MRSPVLEKPDPGDLSRAVPSSVPEGVDLSPGARFRRALAERGGLYAAFAAFLRGRTDLAAVEYAESRDQVRAHAPAIPRAEFAALLSAELGAKGAQLAAGLAPEPCWSTLSRCAYRANFQGRSVVVQVARDPVADGAFAEFESQLELPADPAMGKAADPRVLGQFREWIRLADSPARERRFLAALQEMHGKTLVDYPAVVPELSRGRILCWDWLEGEPATLSRRHVEKITEAVLEQISVLSVVDGEMDLAAMVVTPKGRLVFRRAPRLVALPPGLNRAALQYISAVLSGNSAAGAHWLLELAGGDSRDSESCLLAALSDVRPELNRNRRLSPSAAAFEGNWRALSRIGLQPPLFLDCMHRNLVVAGNWMATTAGASPSAADSLQEAQTVVLGCLVRNRLGELFNSDSAAEWITGSGLVFFETIRHVNRLAGELRDADLGPGAEPADRTPEEARRTNRAVYYGVVSAMLLLTFLVCLHWISRAPEPWSTGLAMIAIFSAAALFWSVSRVG